MKNLTTSILSSIMQYGLSAWAAFVIQHVWLWNFTPWFGPAAPFFVLFLLVLILGQLNFIPGSTMPFVLSMHRKAHGFSLENINEYASNVKDETIGSTISFALQWAELLIFAFIISIL